MNSFLYSVGRFFATTAVEAVEIYDTRNGPDARIFISKNNRLTKTKRGIVELTIEELRNCAGYEKVISKIH